MTCGNVSSSVCLGFKFNRENIVQKSVKKGACAMVCVEFIEKNTAHEHISGRARADIQQENRGGQRSQAKFKSST